MYVLCGLPLAVCSVLRVECWLFVLLRLCVLVVISCLVLVRCCVPFVVC